MYDVYIDRMLCPVTPSKLQVKIKNQNKTVNLINEGQINILKQAGLTEITFDLLLPNVKYPFANYKAGFHRAEYYLNILEKLKTEKNPFYFKVIRKLPGIRKLLSDTNMKVSLEEYTVDEDANEGFDIIVSVKLKQYRDYGTKICTIVKEQPETSEPESSESETSEPESSESESSENESSVTGKVMRIIVKRSELQYIKSTPLPQSYTTVEGDTFWKLAKMFYGLDTKGYIIRFANQDVLKEKPTTSRGYLQPGTVITIPAPIYEVVEG